MGYYDEDTYELSLECTTGIGTAKTLDASDDLVDYIVVLTIENDRDETQTNRDTYTDADFLYENDPDCTRTIVVVAYENLTNEAVATGEDTDSYEQDSYWYYDADLDLVYMVVVRDMKTAQ